jgi:protein-L-isoaspartate(D-aspartate) O-methyltransferase
MWRNWYFLGLIFFWILLSCEGTNSDSLRNPVQVDFQSMKEEMVETQIRARGIKDETVLNAMLKVDRHEFVPEEARHLAYSDRPLPIGEGQTISQPYIVALMTELLELKKGDRVLEIGTGSGYQAAILAELADHLYTIEIIESLGRSAEGLLRKLGYKNITVKIGDGYIGWEEFAPFDAIIVTAAPPHIPQPLLDQLKERGRLVIPVGDYYQELKKITKVKGEIKSQDIIPVVFVPMTGEHVKKKKKK